MNVDGDYDVVIIGGGPAGCAAAIALRRHRPSLRVGIIEKQATAGRPLHIGETLPPASVGLLRQLDLWSGFQQQGFRPAHGTRCCWGSSAAQGNDYLFQALGQGWHLDRRRFDRWLFEEARERGVDDLAPYTLSSPPVYHEGAGGHWRIRLPDNDRQTIRAGFLIDASGRSAVLARQLGAKRRAHDRLVAYYAYLPATASIDTATWVEAVEAGWWYSAPLPDGRIIVALMSDSDIGRRGRFNRVRSWRARLAASDRTRRRVADTADEPAIQVAAAHSQSLDKCVGRRWLAVADAACCFDPLSSLGLFKALRNGLLAAYAVGDVFGDVLNNPRPGRRPELHPGLRKYQALIRAEFSHYQQTRSAYYGLERRFGHHPFWQRRIEPAIQPLAPASFIISRENRP
ncbi:MAG: tryptophan 7-halogenase [Wenzhouxiangellaceae bacterium]